MNHHHPILIAAICLAVTGCQQMHGARSVASRLPISQDKSTDDSQSKQDDTPDVEQPTDAVEESSNIKQTAFQQPPDQVPPPPVPSVPAEGEPPPPTKDSQNQTLRLDDVIESIYRAYPLLRAAEQERAIASGMHVSAWGEFDLKLKAESLNGPTGFYQTYRQGAGIEQPVFENGGTVFGGYRVGRGDFQPWYLERQTNNGGEFKAGLIVPLARNRDIDLRRTGVWLAGFDVDRADPFINMQLIGFVRAGTMAYWDWVAAGRQVVIARALLEIAQTRQAGLQRRVDAGDLPTIELTDNQRMIVSRQTKLIDAERTLQQSAVKLSLFWRTTTGHPMLPTEDQLPPAFPDINPYNQDAMSSDIDRAHQQRPELRMLDIQQRQIEIQMNQADNESQPSLDFTMSGSQDVGQATSKKRDKSEFEVEAGVVFQVPMQRRKALGKLAALEGKLSQLRAKTKFTREKISAEVQAAVAGLLAAAQQVTTAEKTLELTRTMEQAERTKFTAGQSNLLLINIREQASADAAVVVLQARQQFFMALTNLQAATGDSIR